MSAVQHMGRGGIMGPFENCHALMGEADCSVVMSCTVLQLDQLWNYVKIYENAHLNADGTTCSCLHITHDLTRRMPYSSMLLHVNLDSLAARTEDLYRRFFRDIMDPASCLHSLLPPPRSTAITSRLRSSQILPKVYTRVGFVAAAVSMSTGGCRARGSVGVPSVAVDVPIAAELAVL